MEIEIKIEIEIMTVISLVSPARLVWLGGLVGLLLVVRITLKLTVVS